MTKEEALRRFKAAKQTKKDAVAALEQKMKQAYEERTGLKANSYSGEPQASLIERPIKTS